MKNVVLTILILTLSVSTAFLVCLHFFASDDNNLSGEWTANQDMTRQAAAAAFSWLQDIEAVSVSLEDVESYMQNLTIQVNLTLEQPSGSEGTFHCNILSESYEACNQAAYEAFAAAFKELLTKRLLMAGYTGGTDDESIEALITETFGMSTVSYLMSCGPQLLPSLEELQTVYDGSGTYSATEGILIRQFETDGTVRTKTESYIRENSTLILYEEPDSVQSEPFSDYYPVIYTLQQPDS